LQKNYAFDLFSSSAYLIQLKYPNINGSKNPPEVGEYASYSLLILYAIYNSSTDIVGLFIQLLISQVHWGRLVTGANIVFRVIMDTYDLRLEAPWDEVKEMLKEANMDLTDEDLVYQPGQEKELLENLSKKMNKDIFAVKAWIESVSSNKGLAY